MTTPESPTTHDPQGKLDEQAEFGLCTLIVDSRERGNELVCGLPAVDEVLVRNSFGLFVAALCGPHKEQHRQFYRKFNSRRNRPRRKQSR